MQFINEGMFDPIIGGIYDLKELPKAQEDFKAKKFVGNLVIVPAAG